jgi:hypothetical protein
LADIMELEMDEFWAWLKSAQTIDNEIAKQVKAR